VRAKADGTIETGIKIWGNTRPSPNTQPLEEAALAKSQWEAVRSFLSSVSLYKELE